MDKPKPLTIIKTNDDLKVAYSTAIAADITDVQSDTFLPHTIIQAQISFAKNGFALDREHDHIIISRKDAFGFDSHVYDYDQIVVTGVGVYPAVPTMTPEEVLKAFGVPEDVEYKILKAPAFALGVKFTDTDKGQEYWKALKEPSPEDAIRGLSIFGYSIVPEEQIAASAIDSDKLITLQQSIERLDGIVKRWENVLNSESN